MDGWMDDVINNMRKSGGLVVDVMWFKRLFEKLKKTNFKK